MYVSCTKKMKKFIKTSVYIHQYVGKSFVLQSVVECQQHTGVAVFAEALLQKMWSFQRKQKQKLQICRYIFSVLSVSWIICVQPFTKPHKTFLHILKLNDELTRKDQNPSTNFQLHLTEKVIVFYEKNYR